MFGHVFGGLETTQQLLGIAANAVVVDFHGLDLALGVDDEGAAQGQSFVFNHDLEVAAERARGVGQHGETDFPDSVGGVVPGLVGEVRVGGYAVDFGAEFLEFGVVVGQIAQLGRADEGEVGRVEHENRPFALERVLGHFGE